MWIQLTSKKVYCNTSNYVHRRGYRTYWQISECLWIFSIRSAVGNEKQRVTDNNVRVVRQTYGHGSCEGPNQE
jgi:hypothetical protein